MKIYIVSTESYSDYSVRAVCSTKEKAEAVVKALDEDPQYHHEVNDLEEFELDREASRLERGVKVWEVKFLNDFENPTARKSSLLWDENKVVNYPRCGNGSLGPDREYLCMVEAKDSLHAVKIAQERFIQWKAQGGVWQ